MSEKALPRGLPHDGGREPGRVHWMELFFDLVFVAFVGQLAHGIHGNPGWAEFGTLVLLFFPAWWAWVNIVSVVNLLPGLSSRGLGFAMLAAMAAAGLMAAAAPEAIGTRAWAFSLANAAMRVVLLCLWLYQHRQNGSGTPWRIWIYNGGTAAVWLVAALLPLEAAAVLWAVAITAEVVLALLSGRLWPDRGVGNINVDHASERLGLFVVIVLGESVFTIVTELSADWGAGSAIAAVLGFALVALLGWDFFQHGAGTLSAGLTGLKSRADYSGILQTTLFMPFLLVMGLTGVAAAVATAIPASTHALPLGAGIALGGGLTLFHGTNAAVSLRYGLPLRDIAPWAIPAVAVSLVLIPVSVVVPASVELALATLLLLALTVRVEVRRRS